MKTPVAVIFFNRIEPLKQLVARLAEVKPPKIYLISDGARDGREGESEKVAECRKFMTNLPWTCEVYSNFAEKNMGCRMRVISGLDWLFEQEERAIVLEDDCIPELEFFPFMEYALDYYANEEDVISVGGTNYWEEYSPKNFDVIFTKYPVSTGWGTWRRAWQLMDRDLSLLEAMRKNHHLKDWLGSLRAELYWLYILKTKSNSWAYRWAFTAFAHKKISAISAVNLIENVGFFDSQATNTTESTVIEFPRANRFWKFQMRMPSVIESDSVFDRHLEDARFSKSLLYRIAWAIKKLSRLIVIK